MPIDPAIDYHAWPDASGHFGRHGGRFVAETLIGPLEELAAAYDAARVDPAFIEAFETDLAHYVGRPSPIYEAARLTDHVGGEIGRAASRESVGQYVLCPVVAVS